jgi:hypothetical protein
MTIPLIVIFFDQSGSVQDSIAVNHLRNIAIKVADKAETVYYLGQPSKITLEVYFPERIEYFNFTSRTIDIGYRTSDNLLQDISVFSQVNMTGSVSVKPGIHYLEIESAGDKVSVTG